MKHVLWIGGPPAAGKTTIAMTLARRYGLRLYSADTHTWMHRDRALAAGNPAAHRWEGMTPAARWERSTPAEMLEMSLHRERGAMVIDDLRALPDSPLVIAEGSTLPASAISSGFAERSNTVWLVPTAGFQRRALAVAGVAPGPRRLYALLRELIEREAIEHGVPTLAVDGSLNAAEMVESVERRFRAAFVAGPHAETLAERQTLLREINDNTVRQILGYYARPWANGDPGTASRSFVCECGDPACDVDVTLTVLEASSGTVLAPFHRREEPA